MRINWKDAWPEAYKALYAAERAARKSGLDNKLLDLVVLRASQINGCAFCIDMHTKDLRAAGETEQRLYLLSAWREVDMFTNVERAALAWTEAVTRLGDEGVSDAVYEQARKHFSEEQLVQLTTQIVAINGWNRMNVAFQVPAGSYQPGQKFE
jgi:AhpD family alkylhydroperoxidase